MVPGSEGGRGREGEREGREGGREGRGRERAEEKRRGEIGIMFSLEPRSACQSPSCPPDPPNCFHEYVQSNCRKECTPTLLLASVMEAG